MCGRYTLKTPAAELAEAFDLAEIPAWEPRWNVSPSQLGLIVVAGEVRLPRLMRWGLVPAWSDGKLRSAPPINARSETLAQKPMFREAFRRRRALALLDGFYEWRPASSPATLDLFAPRPTEASSIPPTAAKTPLYLQRRDAAPFAIAALWDVWRGGDGEELQSFALVTTTANRLMRTIHDRMPVILDDAGCARWLGEDSGPVEPLFAPLADDVLQAWPVQTLVNAPRNEGPRLLEPTGPIERG